MKSSILVLLFSTVSFLVTGQAVKMTTEKYREDFHFFWNAINNEYSYFDTKQTNWQKVKEIYTRRIEQVSERAHYVNLLEKALNEIYDHHAILNTNTRSSSRLVPSRTDTWAAYVNGKPIITEVRTGFGSEQAGVAAGMEVVAVNDIPIDIAIKDLLPLSLKQPDIEANNFALRLILAGDHIRERKFSLKQNGKLTDYYPDKNGMLLENINYASNIESRLIGTVGYIKINDCLYNNDLIPQFDSVMQGLRNSSSMIIDLRDTPSGGNTTVAKTILSWFITKEHFYQKHEYTADQKNSGVKRSWLEIVTPRKGKLYSKPLVILCNHWTASVGEAIVIGFRALNRPFTKIMGTPMARLNGAIYSYEMPNSKIRFSFPAEKLFAVNGLPREKFVPDIVIDVTVEASAKQDDPFISRALSYLKNKR